MSIWNAILQASHSAMIDQLNETFPDDKLELGLPRRFDAWGVTDGPDQLFFREVKTADGTGVLALATKIEDIKVSTEIFNKTVSRIQKEFILRKIAASFGEEKKEAPAILRMTIWLPIRITKDSATSIYDLGLGV